MAQTHPDLLERALKIESGATLVKSLEGLGRRWSWARALRADRAQLKLFDPVSPDLPCMCFDGGDA